MNDLLSAAVDGYTNHFGSAPAFAAYAPGRVEILGNHCDYNGGWVMAATIDKGTIVAGNGESDRAISLYAADLRRSASYLSTSIERDGRNGWANYMLGVVQQLQKAGVDIEGFKASVSSIIPMGAGLSSSAALEVATALLLKQIYPYELDKMEIAKLCQRAENQFVGVNSGLLDQFSSVLGETDHLVWLDCTTFDYGQVALPRKDLCLVVCDSMVAHSLVGGDYNTRRAECEAAAAYFGKTILREVPVEEFEARKSELPDNLRKRAQHIFDDNARVLQGKAALEAGDAEKFGWLMSQSHKSSRYLFENSTPELDFLVDTASALPGCLGCRLTGGGWGGATVNLVESASVDSFMSALSSAYQGHVGKAPPIFVSAISNGAHILKV